MFNSIRSKLSKLLVGVGQSVASIFDRNVTAPHIVTVSTPTPTKRRKPAFRTGIKGIKGTNNTAYGAYLQHSLKRGGKAAA